MCLIVSLLLGIGVALIDAWWLARRRCIELEKRLQRFDALFKGNFPKPIIMHGNGEEDYFEVRRLDAPPTQGFLMSRRYN